MTSEQKQVPLEVVLRRIEEPSYDPAVIRFLYSAMRMLSEQEYTAVVLRFWQLRSIEEIASELRLSWDEADREINRALRKLRLFLEADANQEAA